MSPPVQTDILEYSSAQDCCCTHARTHTYLGQCLRPHARTNKARVTSLWQSGDYKHVREYVETDYYKVPNISRVLHEKYVQVNYLKL